MTRLSLAIALRIGSGVVLASGLAACGTEPKVGESAAPAEADDDSVVDADDEADAGLGRMDARTPPDPEVIARPDAGGNVVDASGYGEVFAQGLARYVGTKQVKETEVTSGGGDPEIKVHHYSGANRGPLCMYGADFFAESREGSSDTLMIYLQGGGVCLDEICAATPAPILSLQLFNLAALVGIGGVLDPHSIENPAKDFDVVAAPYCDGSLFAGDVDRVLSDGSPANGTQDMAFQRGLQNLTATLETAKKRFPNPSRIILMGSSGGAYGVIPGTPMVRYYYPDTPLLVVSDSGAPIVSMADTKFITRALTELNAIQLIPKSCTDCLANGHATGILEWALRFDPKLSVAYMGHARDHVIGEFFMRMTADQFQQSVVTETTRMIEEFPGRAFRFVIPTSRHTLTMGIDSFGDNFQAFFLGIAGGVIVGSGIGFTGESISPEEMGTWTLGGMKETGIGDDGKSWDAYDWLRQLLRDPAHTPNVFQLELK
jgi:hypothetical protein